MRFDESWGFILLGIWLIVEGIFQLSAGSTIDIILGIIAIIAGILILAPRFSGARIRR